MDQSDESRDAFQVMVSTVPHCVRVLEGFMREEDARMNDMRRHTDDDDDDDDDNDDGGDRKRHENGADSNEETCKARQHERRRDEMRRDETRRQG